MTKEIDPVILSLREELARYKASLPEGPKISIEQADTFSARIAVEVMRSAAPAIVDASAPRKSLWRRFLAVLQGGPPVR